MTRTPDSSSNPPVTQAPPFIPGGSVDAGGNGGGYSGLVSKRLGAYADASGGKQNAAAEFDKTKAQFYFFKPQSTCASYPLGWESVGPQISGIIKFEKPRDESIGFNTTFHAPSACTPFVQYADPPNLTERDFAPDVVLWNEDIFIRASTPPLLTEVAHGLVSCQAIHSLPSAPGPGGSTVQVGVGTDVLVYEKNGSIYARIYQGGYSAAENLFIGTYIAPFPTTSSTTTKNWTYTAPGFSLVVDRDGWRQTWGNIRATIDGKEFSDTLTCWTPEGRARDTGEDVPF